MHEAHSRPNLGRKLCVPVLNSRTATQKFQPVFTEFFVLFAIIKNQPIKLQMVVFVVKYGALYGGIPDSEQLGTDTIWGYPEYGASVRQ